MTLPAPFADVIRLDRELSRYRHARVVPLADMRDTLIARRKARRMCQLYFKPPGAGNTA